MSTQNYAGRAMAGFALAAASAVIACSPFSRVPKGLYFVPFHGLPVTISCVADAGERYARLRGIPPGNVLPYSDVPRYTDGTLLPTMSSEVMLRTVAVVDSAKPVNDDAFLPFPEDGVVMGVELRSDPELEQLVSQICPPPRV